MNPADHSLKGYDIQGQLGPASMGKPVAQGTEPPSGYAVTDKLYTSWTSEPASSVVGTGSDVIPSTAPGLQEPAVPGTPLTPLQKADLVPQGDVPQDPVNKALNANVAAMKDMGVITVSQADIDEEEQGVGVLNVAGSPAKTGF